MLREEVKTSHMNIHDSGKLGVNVKADSSTVLLTRKGVSS